MKLLPPTKDQVDYAHDVVEKTWARLPLAFAPGTPVFLHEILLRCHKDIDYDFPAPAGVGLISGDSHFTVKINPAELAKYNLVDSLDFIIYHEALHIATDTFGRESYRDHKLWNIATDAYINHLLIQDGHTIGGSVNFKPVNLPVAHNDTIEMIYDRLVDEQSKQDNNGQQAGGQDGEGECDGEQSEDGNGKSDEPSSKGSNSRYGDSFDKHRVSSRSDGSGEGGANNADNSSELSRGSSQTGEASNAAASQLAKEVNQQITQSMLARGQLCHGSNLSKNLLAIHKEPPKVDWRAAMRNFVNTASVKERYTWSRPSRRSASIGITLPSRHNKAIKRIVFAIDSSGSVSDKSLQVAMSELSHMCDINNVKEIVVIVCDTQVVNVHTFSPKTMPKTMVVSGRGGTAFEPVFDYIKQEKLEIDGLVYFTDGECSINKSYDPKVPCLWLVDNTRMPTKEHIPFGTLVQLS